VHRAPDGLHNASLISSCRDDQVEWVRKIIHFRQFANTCSADAAQSRRSSPGSSGTEERFLSFCTRKSSTWTYVRDAILIFDAYLKLWAEQHNTVFAPVYTVHHLCWCRNALLFRLRYVLDDPEDAAISDIFFDNNIGGGIAYDSCNNRWFYWPESLYILFPMSGCSEVCDIPLGDAGRWAR
jgi:hypothetical protein